MKYHIDKNGIPAICRAKVLPCPLGGDESHFPTEEEAQKEADFQNEAEAVLSEKTSKEILKLHQKNPIVREKLVIEYGEKLPWDKDLRVRRAQARKGHHLSEAFQEESTKKAAEEYLREVAEKGERIEPFRAKLFEDNEHDVTITRPILNEDGNLFYELDPEESAAAFSRELEKCYNATDSGKQVTIKSEKELKEETKFMLINSTAGAGAIVTTQGEISGVFANKPKQRFVKRSFPILRKNGGKWLTL